MDVGLHEIQWGVGRLFMLVELRSQDFSQPEAFFGSGSLVNVTVRCLCAPHDFVFPDGYDGGADGVVDPWGGTLFGRFRHR